MKGITRRHPVLGEWKRDGALAKLARAREIQRSILNDPLSLPDKERLMREMVKPGKRGGESRRVV